MATSRRAQRHQQQREQLADATARAVLAEWAKVSPDNVARDWARLLPKVTAYVQAGQLHAAEGTHTFMRELLGKDATADAPEIVPEQFASQTPDGRDAMGLLARAAPNAITAQRKGFSPRAAMARAGAFLDMVVRTVVADTGRQADQAAMVGNRGVTGYVRVVELPACSRCIILAGREYGVSSGFLRHPRCDCTMEPVTRKHMPTPPRPADLFESMTPAQRRKVFGEAGAKAIQDGSRISTVVNARKSMDRVEMFGKTVQVTHVGTGSRKKPRPPRLMPEEIYRLAEADSSDPKAQREHAIRLLYKNGYLR
ncbi:VG15 protein [Streptomyces sp. NPDC005166]